MPLRFRKLWTLLGVGFVLLVVYLSLMPDPGRLVTPATMNFGHVVAYGWLMLWFAQIHRAAAIRWRFALAFCLLGVALEYVQGMTGYRTFDYYDMLNDAVGVALGALLARTPLQNGLLTLEARLSA